MSRVGKIARRSFLVGSAAIAGGIAFGVYAAKRPFENPLTDTLVSGEASFNPWIMISGDKITLIAPHGDKGQGVFSVQAALIAEELDIDLDQDDLDITFGKPDKAYYNTALAGALVPFMSVDDSRRAEFMRNLVGGVVKLAMPMMGTGGSSAVPDSYDKLRQAGANARETLKRAASEQTGVPVDQLTTAKGAVQLPGGQEIRYTALATAANSIEPVTEVALRDPQDWRILGKPMKRVDMLGKVTGTLEYGIDVEMDGMVHATVRMNPRQGGPLNGFDDSAAKTMPGVQKIFQIQNGIAVIADNTWRAFAAADAVDCDWGPAPYPAEQADHWKAIANSFNEEQLNAEARNEGDVDAAMDGAKVFSADYKSPYVAHAPLEPLNATILVTEDRVDIWTGHQLQMFLEQIVSDITGVDLDNVHLHNMFMGGSFGHRLEFEHIKQAAEIGMQMKGTPVKLTYKREEDFAHDFPRHPTIGRGKGTVKDGKVIALDLQLAAPSVGKSQMSRIGMNVPGPDNQLHEGAWDNPYFNLPNLRVRSYQAPELAPVSSWRSVGAAPNGFAFDSFLDELIHEAGADPLQERIRLMGHDVSVKVLEAVGEMSNWGSDLGPNRGRGVSFVIAFGVPVAQVVEVTDQDGAIKIDKVFIAADVGKVLDPVNLENMAEGGVVFGLGHAINSEITYSDGMAEQLNYYDAEGMRMHQCPEIHFRALENAEKIRGFGEPPVPSAAPALANAIYDATGQRIRELPLWRHIDFV